MMQIHVKVLCTELFDERSGVKWRFKGDEPAMFSTLGNPALFPRCPHLTIHVRHSSTLKNHANIGSQL